MKLKGKGCKDVDWINPDQDRYMCLVCEHGNEPSGFIKCGEILDQRRNY
jgi:hypothetical protein